MKIYCNKIKRAVFGDRIRVLPPLVSHFAQCQFVHICRKMLITFACVGTLYFIFIFLSQLLRSAVLLHSISRFYHLDACVYAFATLNRRQLDLCGTWNLYQYTWWCLSAEYYLCSAYKRANAKGRTETNKQKKKQQRRENKWQLSIHIFHIDKNSIVAFGQQHPYTHACTHLNSHTQWTIQFHHNWTSQIVQLI